MGSLHSCDTRDFIYAYRERIALSNGTIKCCESGITIPEGFPYADCRPMWWYDETPKIDGEFEEDPDELPTEVLLPELEWYPQAIEIWRLIRNDSAKRGTCPSWGMAVDDYNDTWADAGEQSDRLAMVKLLSTIRRTSTRYKAGKRPRLHPHEAASLKSGEFVRALPFSYKAKVPA